MPFATARSIVSFGMLAFFAVSMIARSDVALTSPFAFLLSTAIRFPSLPHTTAFAPSLAPFCRLICDHLLCPPIAAILHTNTLVLQNGAIIDVMHLLVALAAIAITIGLAYNPGVRHGELAAAAAPVGVMKKQCKPGDVFAVLSDKGGTRIVPLAVNDKRYPNGVVWYRDNVGGWKPLPCKSSPEDAFEQAEQEDRAAPAKEKADTAEFKRDSAAPHPPTGITSEDIGPRDELKPSSTPPEGLDVARKLEELATSPEDARTPRATALEQGNDVSQYIAELKQRSLTPRDDAPAQPQVPQMQDQPASDRTGLEEPSVPLPRERPSAWSRLWSDTPRAIRDFVTNEWDSLTGVPTAPRMNGPDPSAVVADRFLGASEFPQTPLEPSDVINTGRPLAQVLPLPREIAGYTPA